jgi:hypothetical protein
MISGSRPCQHIIVFVEEAQKLLLVLLISIGADAYYLIRDSWVQWYFFEFTLGFYELSTIYRRLSFMLPLLLSQKMYILVTRCEALLNISGSLLAAEDGYDSKSCWYFEAQVCRVQGSFECV